MSSNFTAFKPLIKKEVPPPLEEMSPEKKRYSNTNRFKKQTPWNSLEDAILIKLRKEQGMK